MPDSQPEDKASSIPGVWQLQEETQQQLLLQQLGSRLGGGYGQPKNDWAAQYAAVERQLALQAFAPLLGADWAADSCVGGLLMPPPQAQPFAGAQLA